MVYVGADGDNEAVISDLVVCSFNHPGMHFSVITYHIFAVSHHQSLVFDFHWDLEYLEINSLCLRFFHLDGIGWHILESLSVINPGLMTIAVGSSARIHCHISSTYHYYLFP